MKYEEIEPNENYDARRFRSVPLGLWECGILRMLFGKHRVRVCPVSSKGWVPIDYWGGNYAQANYILGLIMGACSSLPESINEQEFVRLFPAQIEKDLSPVFMNALIEMGETIRANYKVDGLN